MNRTIQTRLAALAASLLVTFALVDAIAEYAFAPAAAQPIVVASIAR